MIVFLETERLILRRFTMDDGPHLCALDSDPEVMRFINGGKPTAPDVIQQHTLPRFLAYYERYACYGFWAAIETSSHECLGWLHFNPSLDQPDTIDLGYRLRQKAWGQGYATEGARALIRKGFTELGTQRVVASALTANQASIRVMEKVGLTLAKRYMVDQDHEAVMYVLNKDDVAATLWGGR